MEWAIPAAIVFASFAVTAGLVLLAGAWFFGIGFAVYAVFERWYNTRLANIRHDAYEAGRNAVIRERGEEIIRRGGPDTAIQAEELTSFAESLKPMYPEDKAILEEVDRLMKLRGMIDAE